MKIMLTPQMRAALPLMVVALVGLLGLVVIAAFLIADRWMDVQIAQMGERIRQAERVRQELVREMELTTESEAGQ